MALNTVSGFLMHIEANTTNLVHFCNVIMHGTNNELLHVSSTIILVTMKIMPSFNVGLKTMHE